MAKQKEEQSGFEKVLGQVVDWKSYVSAEITLKDMGLQGTITHRKLFTRQLTKVSQCESFVDVLKLTLLKTIDPMNVPRARLKTPQIFDIVRTCLCRDSPLMSHKNQNAIESMGLTIIYHTFVRDLCRILSFPPLRQMTRRDRMCLFPCFNFFRYLQTVCQRMKQNIKYRLKDQILQRLQLHILNADTDTDTEKENEIQNELSVVVMTDLKIGSLCDWKREYPLDEVLSALCALNKAKAKKSAV